MAPRKRGKGVPWWSFSPAEARGHAILAAIILWSVAAVIAFAGSGYRSVFGPLKGADFVHLYTLGHVDRETAGILYDPGALYRLQTELVPESAPERYPTVYPPHAAILFRPFAGMSYGVAALLWGAILAAAYAACVRLAWRPFKTVLPDTRLLAAAAAAFPPFWFMVLHGQTTIIPLAGFCLGWWALTHQRRFLAGAAFSLVLLKPQFALVLAPVVLVCREWAMLAGAVSGIGLQLAAMVAVLGSGVVRDYVAVLMRIPQMREMLEPRPEQLHSISALTNGLLGEWGMVAWALLSGLVIARTIQVWRSSAGPGMRVGIVIVASTLVNPHVFAYDATVLAPALIWFAASFYDPAALAPGKGHAYTLIVYCLFLTFLAPTAAWAPVQMSVLLLGGLFVVVSRDQVGSEFLSSSRGNSPARQASTVTVAARSFDSPP